MSQDKDTLQFFSDALSDLSDLSDFISKATNTLKAKHIRVDTSSVETIVKFYTRISKVVNIVKDNVGIIDTALNQHYDVWYKENNVVLEDKQNNSKSDKTTKVKKTSSKNKSKKTNSNIKNDTDSLIHQREDDNHKNTTEKQLSKENSMNINEDIPNDSEITEKSIENLTPKIDIPTVEVPTANESSILKTMLAEDDLTNQNEERKTTIENLTPEKDISTVDVPTTKESSILKAMLIEDELTDKNEKVTTAIEDDTNTNKESPNSTIPAENNNASELCVKLENPEPKIGLIKLVSLNKLIDKPKAWLDAALNGKEDTVEVLIISSSDEKSKGNKKRAKSDKKRNRKQSVSGSSDEDLSTQKKKLLRKRSSSHKKIYLESSDDEVVNTVKKSYSSDSDNAKCNSRRQTLTRDLRKRFEDLRQKRQNRRIFDDSDSETKTDEKETVDPKFHQPCYVIVERISDNNEILKSYLLEKQLTLADRLTDLSSLERKKKKSKKSSDNDSVTSKSSKKSNNSEARVTRSLKNGSDNDSTASKSSKKSSSSRLSKKSNDSAKSKSKRQKTKKSSSEEQNGDADSEDLFEDQVNVSISSLELNTVTEPDSFNEINNDNDIGVLASSDSDEEKAVENNLENDGESVKSKKENGDDSKEKKTDDKKNDSSSGDEVDKEKAEWRKDKLLTEKLDAEKSDRKKTSKDGSLASSDDEDKKKENKESVEKMFTSSDEEQELEDKKKSELTEKMLTSSSEEEKEDKKKKKKSKDLSDDEVKKEENNDEKDEKKEKPEKSSNKKGKKGTGKKRNRVIMSESEGDSNKEEDNQESDDANSNNSDNSDDAFQSKKKRKKQSTDSDEKSSSSEKKKKKLKRIKTINDSDESTDDEGGKRKSRKNIRSIKGDKSLSKTTRQAAKEEEERKKRITDRQKLYNQMFDIVEQENSRLDQLVLDFDPETKEELVKVHPKLVEKLKPHQAKGVKFMWDACFESLERAKKDKGSGCILAHCMGLGKTLQVVTLIHTLLTHEETGIKTILVVCPLNTVLNWVHEFKLWLSEINDGEDVNVFELSKYKKNFERSYQIDEWQECGGVLVIGYEMYRLLSNETNKKIRKKILNSFQRGLVDPGPDLVVCDEGHLLKNEKSRLSIAMNRLTTLRRIVLTGTPVQNNLKEYFCMVQFVKPNLLGKYNEYTNRFVNPITNGQYTDSTPRDIALMKRRSHVLHKMLDGVVQRRDYNVLAPFLPPKHEYVIFLQLKEIQVKLYGIYMKEYSGRSDLGGKAVALFADFQELQRIWTHPRMLRAHSDKYERERDKKMLSEDEDSEGSLRDFIDDSEESAESTPASDDDDVISINSDDDAPVKSKKKKKPPPPRRRTRAMAQTEPEEEVKPEELKPHNPTEWWCKHIDGEELDDIRCSAKLLVFFDILKKCEAIGDKLLVFSQSLYSLDLLQHFLDRIDEATQAENSSEQLAGHTGSWALGLDYFRLDGSSSAENRAAWCKSFNREDNPRARLFLISTRAGGLGINLVAANRVIIFDVSWNPSHDVQSIFRIYRFGQKKPCYVYRFIAMGTMEEKVYERQVTKQAISKRVIDEQQIDRHYNQNDLAELYKFDPVPEGERPIPKLPKDRMFAELLQEHESVIYRYHEHDSLLENKEEEELNEEERKAAWEEFENEKIEKPAPFTFNQGMFGGPSRQIAPEEAAYAIQIMLRQENPTWPNEEIRRTVPLILQQMYRKAVDGDWTLYNRVANFNVTLQQQVFAAQNHLMGGTGYQNAAGMPMNKDQMASGRVNAATASGSAQNTLPPPTEVVNID